MLRRDPAGVDPLEQIFPIDISYPSPHISHHMVKKKAWRMLLPYQLRREEKEKKKPTLAGVDATLKDV